MFIDVMKMFIAGWLYLIVMTVVLVSDHSPHYNTLLPSSHSLPGKMK